MNKKRLGISLRVEHIAKYNEKRDALSQDWIIFLEKLNVVPILIPNKLSNVNEFLTEMKIDGVILSGGDNIGKTPERDKTENEIIKFAIDSQTPIIGVCRGMQVLNHYFGGTIISSTDSKHAGKSHFIEFTDNKIKKLFGTNLMKVNSFHHNLIKKESLGTDLEIFAISKLDSTIEGYFHKKLPIIGVMWHPERDHDNAAELILMKIFQDRSIWNK